MEQELLLIEEFLKDEYDNLNSYSKKPDLSEAKEGFEKVWSETKNRVEQLWKILKVVNVESHALKKDDRKNLASVAERLLTESASASVYGDADAAEIVITDQVHGNEIARFNVKMYFHCVLFKGYQFY